MIRPDADLRTTLTDCTSAHSLEPSMHRTQVCPDADLSSITVRPVYEGRRSLRQKFGIYANGVLTVITCRYPSKLMRKLV